jgi:hypothetical protein
MSSAFWHLVWSTDGTNDSVELTAPCPHKATLTLKKEAARSKANSTVFRNPTLCQNPEVYHLVSTHCEELDICRICIGALVYLSLVLSVCPSSIPSFNYGHQYCRYDFTQLAANIMKLETSPHQCTVNPCLHKYKSHWWHKSSLRQTAGDCKKNGHLMWSPKPASLDVS